MKAENVRDDTQPCTAAAPSAHKRVHPDAREIGEQRDGYPGGDKITLLCPHCGLEWDEELPQ